MIKDKITDFIESVIHVKWYVVAIMVCYLLFTYAGFTGRKIIGDDTNEKEIHSGGSARNGFYHK